MKITNATPHPIDIVDHNGTILHSFLPSGKIIRLSSETSLVGHMNGIRLTKTIYGSTDLPQRDKDKVYIVSQLVKSAFPDRVDFYVPAEVVRDEEGRIIGCCSLGI
jgi:hypothetical protein